MITRSFWKKEELDEDVWQSQLLARMGLVIRKMNQKDK